MKKNAGKATVDAAVPGNAPQALAAANPRQKAGLGVIAMLGVAIALPALWLVLEGSIYLGNGTDLYSYQIPLRSMVHSALLAGHWPGWNPFELGGLDAHAGMQLGLTYPPDLLASLLSDLRASSWLIALHLLGLSIGALRLGRWLGRELAGLKGWLPGVVLAAALVGSGPVWGHVYAGHVSWVQAVAWVPWIWLFALMAVRSRQWSSVFAAVGALGAQVLAGHPQVTYLALVGLCFALLAEALVGNSLSNKDLSPRSWQRWPGTVAALAVLLLLVGGAALLAAMQWLPTAMAQGTLNRNLASQQDIAFAFSATPQTLWTLIAPTVWGGLQAQPVDVAYHETVAFVGAIVLGLALFAVCTAGLRAWILGFGALFCFALSAGNKLPLLPNLLDMIPGIGAFRVPGRWVLPGVLLLAVLGTQGMALLLQEPSKTANLRRWPAIPLALAVLLLLGLDLGMDVDHGWWADVAKAGRLDLRLAPSYLGTAQANLAWAALCIGLVAAAVARPAWRPSAAWLLAVAAVGQGWWLASLHLQSGAFHGESEVSWTPQERAALTKAIGTQHRLVTAASLRQADWGGTLGIGIAGGYEPAVTATANRYGNQLAMRPMDGYAVNFQARRPTIWLDRLAVSHLLLPGADPNTSKSFEAWPVAQTFDSARVLRSNPKAFSRIAAPGQIQVIADEQQALLALPRLPPETVLLSESLPHTPGAQATITVQSDALSPLAFTAQVTQPTVVVVRDAWAPGWQVQVDGRPSKIVKADAMFRAISLPAGIHNVQFDYTCPGLRVGLLLSAAAWLLWLAGWLIVARRRGSSAF